MDNSEISSEVPTAGPTIALTRFHPSAPDLQKAEKSAAGVLPAMAFQYCEAARRASSSGWYVYPPQDTSLLFDGTGIYFHDEDHWCPVKSLNFEDDARAPWRDSAPDDLRELDPPFLTELPAPGMLQMWSGYFISTPPRWSALVRPLVNVGQRNDLQIFEGIIDTDEFKPCPLFINMRLLKTDCEIFLDRGRPLFQIQLVSRPAHEEGERLRMTVANAAEDGALFAWDGVRQTIRRSFEREAHRPGRYAAARRKSHS